MVILSYSLRRLNILLVCLLCISATVTVNGLHFSCTLIFNFEVIHSDFTFVNPE